MQPTGIQSGIWYLLIKKRGSLFIAFSVFVCWVFLSVSGCDYPRRDFPDLIEVFTLNIDSVGLTRAAVSGKIAGEDREGLLSVGHCWSKDKTLPTFHDAHSNFPVDALQTDFKSKLTGLSPQTVYFVRGYLIFESGGRQDTIYEPAARNFTTATLDLIAVDFALEGEKVKVRSLVSGLSGDTVTNYGHCWSGQNPLPEIQDNISSVYSDFHETVQDTTFEEYITGLVAGVTYFIRIYAVLNNDTFYSDVRSAIAGNSWVQLQSFQGAGAIFHTGFALGQMVCVGVSANTGPTEWWRYNTEDSLWTQMAQYPYRIRNGATAFTIGPYAYIVGRRDGVSNYQCDVFAYDAALNIWIGKTPCPAQGVENAAAFVIDTMGYVCTGLIPGALGTGSRSLWAYDPADTSMGYDSTGKPMGKWTRKADFAGSPRFNATGFAVGRRGYTGAGEDYAANVIYNDFWEYNPDAGNIGPDNKPDGMWMPVKSLGSIGRTGAFSFAIGDYGYVGGGVYNNNFIVKFNDLWRYNPQTGEWSVLNPVPDGTTRFRAIGIARAGKAYVTPGNQQATVNKSFWEYVPSF